MAQTMRGQDSRNPSFAYQVASLEASTTELQMAVQVVC